MVSRFQLRFSGFRGFEVSRFRLHGDTPRIYPVTARPWPSSRRAPRPKTSGWRSQRRSPWALTTRTPKAASTRRYTSETTPRPPTCGSPQTPAACGSRSSLARRTDPYFFCESGFALGFAILISMGTKRSGFSARRSIFSAYSSLYQRSVSVRSRRPVARLARLSAALYAHSFNRKRHALREGRRVELQPCNRCAGIKGRQKRGRRRDKRSGRTAKHTRAPATRAPALPCHRSMDAIALDYLDHFHRSLWSSLTQAGNQIQHSCEFSSLKNNPAQARVSSRASWLFVPSMLSASIKFASE